MTMKIEEQPIDSVIPYEFNNRVHNEQQVNRIANSIEQFGFNQPIVVDESNIVLVGHGRLLAARKLGRDKVPVLKRQGLSETSKKAYRILDNKLQNDSTWDFNNIELEIGFLEDNEFDLKQWGLDDLNRFFGVKVEDVKEEWDGMPEFQQGDEMPYRTLYVHFKSDADATEFGQLVGQHITDKTKSIWYPKVESLNVADKRYA